MEEDHQILGAGGPLGQCSRKFISNPDNHLIRMRYVHQVFLLAVSILKNEAFQGLQASDSVGQKDEWDAPMRNESQQFEYWSLVLDLEMLQ